MDRLKTLGVLLIITYRPEFQPPWEGQHGKETTDFRGYIKATRQVTPEFRDLLVERTTELNQAQIKLDFARCSLEMRKAPMTRNNLPRCIVCGWEPTTSSMHWVVRRCGHPDCRAPNILLIGIPLLALAAPVISDSCLTRRRGSIRGQGDVS